MGKQGFLYIALGVMFGMTITLGVWLATERNQAYGQTAMGNAGMVLATGQVAGRGNASALYMYDSEKHKLAVVFVNNNNLEVLAVRDMQYDWIPDAYTARGGKQIPTVEEMKEFTKKKR